MRQMVDNGEVDALVPERVWQEIARGLMEAQPSRMFQVLRDCGALARLFPEIDRLFGVPQPPEHHPEIDTGVHVMLVVDWAARQGFSLPVRFAALTHDLGKGVTPPELWPKHHGHEAKSVELVRALCERIRVPATAVSWPLRWRATTAMRIVHWNFAQPRSSNCWNASMRFAARSASPNFYRPANVISVVARVMKRANFPKPPIDAGACRCACG